MYQIIMDGVPVALTEAPNFIKKHENGSLVLCRESEADGIAHGGAVHKLLGRQGLDDHGDLETVTLQEIDAGELQMLTQRASEDGELFKSVFKSITVDNGTEFSDCVGLERSVFDGWRTKFYYCHPYSSYERGSNEKQNQMLRRHFPKGTNFDTVSDEEVERVTNWLNNYPRLKLGWGTSADLFDAAISSIVAAH